MTKSWSTRLLSTYVVTHSGSAMDTPIKEKIKVNLYDLGTTITMSKRNTMLWSRVQGKEPQCSKFPSLDQGEKGSPSKVEWEALLPSKAEGKNLCMENLLELDLASGCYPPSCTRVNFQRAAKD
jgi:hypothetical protein